jgi:endogenous inhibitor of DNA gyrase (YacG/DUF329 family)
LKAKNRYECKHYTRVAEFGGEILFYECNLCKHKCSSYRGIRSHILRKHIEKKLPQVPIKKLKNLQPTMEPVEQNKSSYPQKNCPHCNALISIPPNIQFGICPDCKGKIEIDENRIPHMDFEKTQQCPWCSMTLDLSKINPLKPFLCHYCNNILKIDKLGILG